MATAQDIINAAYHKVGVIEPTGNENGDALTALNNMISLWSIDGLIVPFRTFENFALVVNQSSYTIGSSANFNTIRPLEIIFAYIRDASSVDHSVNPMTQKEYVGITNKTTSKRPELFYYDPQYPLGIIYFDSKPDIVETLYLITEKTLTEFATLATDIALPEFYKEPLVYNLAARLGLDLGLPTDNTLALLAVATKNTLENYIAKNKLLVPVKMESALLNQYSNSNITSG